MTEEAGLIGARLSLSIHPVAIAQWSCQRSLVDVSKNPVGSRDLPKWADTDEMAYKADRAYARIVLSGKVTETDLQLILAAAYDARRAAWHTGTDRLAKLTGKHREVRDAVARMMEDRRLRVRLNGVLSIGHDTPRPFATEILGKGLHDKSARVRAIAANSALVLNMRELLPDLAQQCSVEPNAQTRGIIDSSLRLVRDGYILEPAGPKRFYVTIRKPDGVISGRHVTQEEIDRKGFQALVRTWSEKQ
jgi:hypothetical protein